MARVLTRTHTGDYFKFVFDHAGQYSPLARRGVVALLLALAAIVGPAAPASAQPSLAEIEAELDAQWLKLEPVIEQYNKVRSELKANQKKAAELDKRIVPLSLQAELAADEIGEVANRYYRTGPSTELNALLKTGSPTSLADQLLVLDRISKQRQQQIATVVETRDRYLTERRALDELIAKQKAQDDRRRHRQVGTGAAGRVPDRRLLGWFRRLRAVPGRIGRWGGGHCGPHGVRADRQTVRLGGHRAERVRLFGSDSVRVGERGRRTYPLHRCAVEPGSVGQSVRGTGRRSCILLQ